MKDPVNCPIKWSLYCPLALCVDHLSRETGYLNVLWRTRCSQPKFKRLKDMTVRKYEQLQSFTYIFDLLLKSSNIMFSNNAMHKIKILHLKRLLHLYLKFVPTLIRVGHRRNDDPTIVYMTLLLKYTTAQILVLMKRVLKLREGRRMK